jgi:hypothetical protein
VKSLDEADERQDKQDHDDDTDNIKDVAHERLSSKGHVTASEQKANARKKLGPIGRTGVLTPLAA